MFDPVVIHFVNRYLQNRYGQIIFLRLYIIIIDLGILIFFRVLKYNILNDN